MAVKMPPPQKKSGRRKTIHYELVCVWERGRGGSGWGEGGGEDDISLSYVD